MKTKCKTCGGAGYVLKKDPVLMRTGKLDCEACGGEGYGFNTEAYNDNEAARDVEHDEYLRG